MPDLEDLGPLREIAAQKRRDEKIYQAEQKRAVATTMAELLADPRWRTYAEHLEALRHNYERQMNAHIRMLLETEFLDRNKYGEIRVGLAKAKSAMEAFQQALELAEKLIAQGTVQEKNN